MKATITRSDARHLADLRRRVRDALRDCDDAEYVARAIIGIDGYDDATDRVSDYLNGACSRTTLLRVLGVRIKGI